MFIPISENGNTYINSDSKVPYTNFKILKSKMIDGICVATIENVYGYNTHVFLGIETISSLSNFKIFLSRRGDFIIKCTDLEYASILQYLSSVNPEISIFQEHQKSLKIA